METIQSVLLSVRPGDWMASIDLREAYLQVPVHPESRPFLRFVTNGQVYQFKALCFGLSTAPQVFTRGHGSCFCHPTLAGYPHAALPRRLARSVLLSRVSPPRSPGCPGSLSGAGYCGQPREIQPRSLSGGSVSRGGPQCPVFCGFSVAGLRLQACINRRRISVLRLASHSCLALSAGDAFLHGSPRPWRETSHEVSSALPSSVLGSGGPVDSCGLVPGLPSRSAVVAPPASAVSGGVPLSGVSRPGLLVRRLGRRVGCPSGLSCRFRPLGRVVVSSLYQRQGAPCRPSGSPPLSVICFGQDSGGVMRQRHCCGVSSQRRGIRSPFLNSIAQEILSWSESLHISLAP